MSRSTLSTRGLNLFIASLALTILGACNTLEDVTLDERNTRDAQQDPRTGGGDALVDPGDVDSDDPADVDDTSPSDADADAPDDASTTNGCGGEDELRLDGELVGPGDPCGDCGDGVVACNGPNAVRCLRASIANECGGCSELDGAPSDPCGVCEDGLLACTEDGALTCEGSTDLNLCGGCSEIEGLPGRTCELDGEPGVLTCLSPSEIGCVSTTSNACGGMEPLDAIPGTPCGDCELGVWTCNGPDALTCEGVDRGVNACGGCGGLRASPGSTCGLCRGAWTCDEENPDLVFCDEPERNECGGCSELRDEPGAECDVNSIWTCQGTEELRCMPNPANACGGNLVLTGEPGDRCGDCEDGFFVCTTPNATSCVGASALNACGGCGGLAGAPGASCGPRHVWECTDEGRVDCVPLPESNACGGFVPLDGFPGERCGLCGSGVWACEDDDTVVCSGENPDAEIEFFGDADGDGFGDPDSETVVACEAPDGFVANAEDCDDTDEAIHPDAEEVCDGDDNDCDGTVDLDPEGMALAQDCYTGPDGTRDVGVCVGGLRRCTEGAFGDCEGEIVPSDEACDELDNDCNDEPDDGLTFVDYYPDEDGDGFGDALAEPTRACTPPEGMVADATDCDDAAAAIHPGAEEIVSDGVDSDCDGAELCYADADDDGFRVDATVVSEDLTCTESGEATALEPAGDCADDDAERNPAADELPGDGVDSDCDEAELCYVDADGDGFRTDDVIEGSGIACDGEGEAIAALPAGDCDDENGSVHPSAEELPGDEVDSDCDGEELCYVNADGDGHRIDETVSSENVACDAEGEATADLPADDCDDTSAAVNPSAEEIPGDQIDGDCDGTELCFIDGDRDGYRTEETTRSFDLLCGSLGQAIADLPAGDCDDGDPDVHPTAEDATGDGVDSDCDGTELCYVDADGDGYRTDEEIEGTTLRCDGEGEGSADDLPGDCDDERAAIHPGAAETAGDGVDSDCDGLELCYVDADGDGYRTDETTPSARTACDGEGEAPAELPAGDCDDGEESVHPGAIEIAGDQVDGDCDGTELCYLDGDRDGYRTAETTRSFDIRCDGLGLATALVPAGDCDDGELDVNPAARDEIGDEVDSDCDGIELCFVDADGDGVRPDRTSTVESENESCRDPGEATAAAAVNDCDDSNPDVFPGGRETIGDGVDGNCDGAEWCFQDNDRDGWRLDDVTIVISFADLRCDGPREAGIESGSGDCDDSDPEINPGMEELVGDEIDSDCDGVELCWADADGDGFRSEETVESENASCRDEGEARAIARVGDCRDDDAAINPDALELPGDAVDQNCDGQELCFVDGDGDGFRTEALELTTDIACEEPGHALASESAGDCNDSDAAINPGATELVGDEVDSDCDGGELCYLDEDEDGARTADTTVSVDRDCNDRGEARADETGGDCDDDNADVRPGAPELCDELDNDCNGDIDDGVVFVNYFPDSDGDGFGDADGMPVSSCGPVAGHVTNSRDCDDSLGTISPVAAEVCDGVDNDCDGEVDEPDAEDATTWFADADGDGHGDPADSVRACTQPDGFVASPTDCDDARDDRHPDLAEVCDAVDNDCNGLPDDGLDFVDYWPDADEDGFGDASEPPVNACAAPVRSVTNDDDCADDDPAIFPGADELAGDGVDQDCDGVELCYVDADGDGFRRGDDVVESPNLSCADAGEADQDAAEGDCADDDALIFPGAVEQPGDEIDSDCDGEELCYVDFDGDGFYVDEIVRSEDIACDAVGEASVADEPDDCADDDASIFPGAFEIPGDEQDYDCDGTELCYHDADRDGYRTDETRVSGDLDCVDPGEATADVPSGDCDDGTASTNPGADDDPGDGVDQDCDGTELCYVDADGDGYRTEELIASAGGDCTGEGDALVSAPAGDCADDDPAVHPGATETVGDELDGDCDGTELCFRDGDGDGYRTEATLLSSNASCGDLGEAAIGTPAGDCNDANASINPGRAELVGDGVDSDCDGGELCYADADGDGYRTDESVVSADPDCVDEGEARASAPSGDCADTDPERNPAATELVGDGVDSDCDGGELCYADADGDGYRTNVQISSDDPDCADAGEALASAPSGDCADDVAAQNPGETELAGDGVDQDCDGNELCYVDADNDGARTDATVLSSDLDCNDAGEARADETSGDCDDGNPDTLPGAPELCDGEDNDCNGEVDDGVVFVDYFPDGDGDGFGEEGSAAESSCAAIEGKVTNARDCNDGDPAISPIASEVCDTVDNDCDTEVDEDDADDATTWYADTDGDGFGDPAVETIACDAPTDFVANADDCDDSQTAINPDATEVCDGEDNDCNGEIDEGLVFASYWPDTDDDGFGDAAAAPVSACAPVDGHVENDTDCDDTLDVVNPDATETTGNERDDDCDGGEICFVDGDGDGFRTEATVASANVSCTDSGEATASQPAGDCDDGSVAIRPDATERPGDEVDQNCDGAEICYVDADGDGYRLTTTVASADTLCDASGEAQGVAPTGDCDDTRADIFEGAPELCDGADNDCDDIVDNDADTDGDGAFDCLDPCVNDPLDDRDGDGVCDSDEGCPDDPDKLEAGVCGCGVADTDTDGDGVSDCNDICPNSATDDSDGDGVCDDVDLCPADNPDDTDGDGVCDSDDGCPSDPDKSEPGVCGCGVADTDTDGDGVADCNDPCPRDVGDDGDGDGVCNSDDGCPVDPEKTEPGICGCGVSDADSDSDGVADCDDGCPSDPDKTVAGICGCGVSDVDTDGDGVSDCDDPCPADDPDDSDGDGTCDSDDGCPTDPDKTAAGVCGCGVSDVDSDGDGVSDCNDPCPDDNPDDSDGDGTCDSDDACPSDPDKTALGACGCGVADTDRDADGVADCNDPCPDDNPDDSDADGTCDSDDGCPDDSEKITAGACGCGVPDVDTDEDGVLDCNDPCPSDNPDDRDGDGTCDSDDACPTDPSKTEAGICGCGVSDVDSDGDGVADCNDPCPDDNPDDTDGDGTCDSDDGCPSDPDKVAAGVCGCGVSDVDSDGDGTADCNDACPSDPDKTAEGACGCGVADTDGDADGVADCNDACPSDPDKTAEGACGCGVADTDGDADGVADCNDPCPLDNPDDSDGDGTCDSDDGCPSDPDKIAAGVCGCGVPDIDADADGVPDCDDPCPADNPDDSDGDGTCDSDDGCPSDPDKVAAGACGCGVADTDTDGDGTPDCQDDCPDDPNKVEPGECGCGVADIDTDGDGVLNCNDPCPLDNPDDSDGDGFCDSGDPCPLDDPDDSDGDGVCDSDDGCPLDPAKTAPGICGCGIADTDSDGDGVADCNDPCPADNPDDTDSDGTCDSDDGCPSDPDKIAAGVCGCGVADTDSDGDGVADCNDSCPSDPNKTAEGVCGCGVADTDSDGDGVADCDDGCPSDPNKTAEGVCGCGVADTDSDGDGVADCVDPCPIDSPDDSDGDGVCDSDDVCPGGNDLLDDDGDGFPDECDICPGDPDDDLDADGACAPEDCAPSDPNIFPTQTELCDGIDNNCVGGADEDFTDLGDACGVGDCAGGVRVCNEAKDGTVCSTAGNATAEVCDGEDNDCNGVDDNGFSLGVACGIGDCAGGITECNAAQTGTRCSTMPGGSADASRPELCDGADHDCDGDGLNGFDVGDPCDGIGECGAGLKECNASGSGTICSTDAGGSEDGRQAEICDGLDNDCDGTPDEEFPLGEPCDGVGLCGAGTTECAPDASGVQCSTDVGGSEDESVPELCNGFDDDCDGTPDEGFALGTACGVGPCSGGGTECTDDGSGTRCSTMPGGSEDASSIEVCDGVDNDCTGTPDDAAIETMCTLDNAEAFCDGAGGCKVQSCDAGFDDCDGSAGNGCEANIGADDENCGACGVACSVGFGCVESACWYRDLVASASLGSGANASDGFTCAIDIDGGGRTGPVACAGEGSVGELGDGASSDSPFGVLFAGANAVDLCAGENHACAVLGDGTVGCWGEGDSGRLGDGSTSDNPTPNAVSLPLGATDVECAERATCAILRDGTVRCWGRGSSGQLGNGSFTTTQTTPVQVTGLTDAVQLSGGPDGDHFCAVRATGEIACWGEGSDGQLGDGSAGDNELPVSVSGVTDAVVVMAGRFHSCAIREAGGVVCWGDNAFEQLGFSGSDSTTPVAHPSITTATGGRAGRSDSCVVTTDDQVVCWGERFNFTVGGSVPSHVSAASHHMCFRRTAGDVTCHGVGDVGQLGNPYHATHDTPLRLPEFRDIAEIAASEGFTCARANSGTVHCWGQNGANQLGDGTSTAAASPRSVSGLTDATRIAVTRGGGCAVRKTGEVVCWGDGSVGQLGHGQFASSSTPVTVSGLEDAVGIDGGFAHYCAVTSGAELLCWGENDASQLGDGTVDDASTPVMASVGSDIAEVAAGVDFTCTRSTSDSIQCWGGNDFGQLGDGTTNPSAAPVTLAGGSAIDAGHFSACVIGSGQVGCWGRGDFGQQGDGAFDDNLSPAGVPMGSALRLVRAWDHTHGAIPDDANAIVRTWGDGPHGDGTNAARATDGPVSGVTNVIAATVGDEHGCVVERGGAVFCWGDISTGAVGTGSFGSEPGFSRFAMPCSDGDPDRDADGFCDSVDCRDNDPTVNPNMAEICDGVDNNCDGEVDEGFSLGASCGDGRCAGGVVECNADGSGTRCSTEDGGSNDLARAETCNGEDDDCDTLVDEDDADAMCGFDNASASCDAGSCTLLSCDTGFGDCDANDTNGCEARFDDDPSNCGGCGIACDTGYACMAGQCWYRDWVATSGNQQSPNNGFSCFVDDGGQMYCTGEGSSGELGDGGLSDTTTPVAPSGLGTAIDIAAGEVHACAVQSDGIGYCWGEGEQGRLGHGGEADKSTPTQVTTLTGLSDIEAGDDFSCALLTDGTVWCWGEGQDGQLGNDTTPLTQTTPVQVTGLTDAVQLSAGADTNFACAVRETGEVACWGGGGSGQLGHGSSPSVQATAVTVVGISTAIGVGGGRDHACAVLSDGSVQCWGSNAEGQLGDTGSSTSTPRAVPGISDAVAIRSGDFHTCAVRATGAITCWGRNVEGQLGDGTTASTSTPVTVSGISTATHVDAGAQHSCARLANGTFRCWGYGLSGQLGNGGSTSTTPDDVHLPCAPGNPDEDGDGFCDDVDCDDLDPETYPGAAEVCDGVDNDCEGGVDEDFTTLGDACGVGPCAGGVVECDPGGSGTTVCSTGPGGSNDQSVPEICDTVDNDCDGTPDDEPGGEMCPFDNATASCTDGVCEMTGCESGFDDCNASSTDGCEVDLNADSTNCGACGVVCDQGYACMFGSCWYREQIGAGGTFALGDQFSCAIVEGDVHCWGDADLVIPSSTKTNLSVESVAGKQIVDLGVGGFHACATMSDGTGWCWGSNSWGMRGAGGGSTPSEGNAVAGVTDFVDVAAGTEHSCGLHRDGTVSCWGRGINGAVGQPDTGSDYPSPELVAGIGDVVQLGVDPNSKTTCALKSDGTVWCWGENGDGEIGSGATSGDVTTPTQVSGITDAVQIGGGGDHNCAVHSDGSVSCWGDNTYTQLGDSTASDPSPSPVTVPGISTAVAVDGGWRHTCAVLSTGGVTCWGESADGRLGDGTSSGANLEPVTVSGIDDAIQVSVGEDQSCVLHATGRISCWGDNTDGQLGDGSNTDRSTPVRVDFDDHPCDSDVDCPGGFCLPGTVGRFCAYNDPCSSNEDCAAGICVAEMCTVGCGNGEVEGGETCDDGNTEAGDGCSASCALEADFVCVGEPSTCYEECPGGTCSSGTCSASGICAPEADPTGYVYVPPGTFAMGAPMDELGRGSDELLHAVTLTRGYWLHQNGVTNAQWSALMGTSPSANSGCSTCPVDRINWWEAIAYTNALSDAAGQARCYTLSGCEAVDPGNDMDCSGVTVESTTGSVYDCVGYRLPTEAEWERAYRAGTRTAFYNGAITSTTTDSNADLIAWYDPNTNGDTEPVAGKAPNAWSLYDMAGNTWDLVWDNKAAYDFGHVVDPAGPGGTASMVHRGGSWFDDAFAMRAALRNGVPPGNTSVGTLGVRPARTAFPAHCSDSTLNADEDAVDCGGACPACSGGLPALSECAVDTVCSSSTCSNGVCAPDGFVLIPAGTFTMGSPTDELGRSADETEHSVTLTNDFFMQTTEVTQSDWSTLIGTTPSGFSSCGNDCPVEDINWWEALAYANALSLQEGLAPCYVLSGCDNNRAGEGLTCTGVTVNATDESPYLCEGYRLPTESEWEYAYRAGTTTAFYNGAITETGIASLDPNLDAIGWYGGNAGSTTHTVGGKTPNAWGLFDMSGNVFEWTWDWLGDYPSGSVTDPTGLSSGSTRVTRGGSWAHDARSCRAAHRLGDSPANHYNLLGVRVARTVWPSHCVDGATSGDETGVDCGGSCVACEPLPTFDADGDGYCARGTDFNGDRDCEDTGESSVSVVDCDDGAATVHPSAPDVCDGLDNDCDGSGDPSQCDASCSVDTFAGKGYQYCDVNMGWFDARTFCQASGGDMVIIESEAENEAVRAMRNTLSDDIWLGATGEKPSDEVLWTWWDGRDFWSGGPSGSAIGGMYSNWSSGQPDSTTGEVCALMWSSGKWNDHGCSNNNPMCEVDGYEPSHCNDGYRSGDEESADCGGSCAACP